VHQPYTNQSVFKSLLNFTSEISRSRNATGSEFQRHGPATEKLLSPRCIRVLFVAHVKTSANRSDRRPMSKKNFKSRIRCALVLQSRVCGFDSQLFHLHITTLGMLFTHVHLNTKQYNILTTKRRSVAVNVRSGPVESNDSLLPGLGMQVTAQRWNQWQPQCSHQV